ncbi:Dna Dc-_Du-Editing Enzyme Apobec-3A [Manis pentadactyla]|nr:Dna Dc->Du-Editing Enzyme Apobec-3A [Manis pentadactyla]
MTRDLCSTADNILSSKKCELAIYHLLHMDTKKPSKDNGFIRNLQWVIRCWARQRHRLDEDTFLENFSNDLWPGKTCLCYEVTPPVGDTRVPLGQERGFLHNKFLGEVDLGVTTIPVEGEQQCHGDRQLWFSTMNSVRPGPNG